MPVKPKPDGYQNVIPYLVVEDAAKLLDFLKATFGAEEIDRTTEPSGRVRHAEARIGDSVVMMGSASDQVPKIGASIYVYVDDTDATYRRALAAGATSQMEPKDQFYGDRNAGVVDPFGLTWWIGTRVEDVSKEEIARRMRAAEGGPSGG